MNAKLTVGLDLGTSFIRIAVGRSGAGAETQSPIQMIGAVETPSEGIAKGNVTSLDDAVSAVSACLEHAERLVGMPLQEVTVGIGGTSISSQLVRGVVGVSRPEGDIRPEDVERVIEAAKFGLNPANVEILHVLPRNFCVDGQAGIKDSVGMQGIRLEVEAQIVQGLSSHVRNLATTAFRTGLDISELVYGPIAATETVTTRRERELGVCVLVIGGSTTGMVVYEDGELLHAVTLPIGSDHITSDIAIGLRITLDAAEQIKRTYGRADAENIPKRGSELDLSAFGVDPRELVPLRFLTEIIQARVEEIYEKVELELQRIGRSGMLPAGVILTGGGSKLPGLIEVCKRLLRLPCAQGHASVASPLPELIEDPAFSTAIGLALWSFGNFKHGESNRPRIGRALGKGKIFIDRLKRPFGKFMRSFLP